MKITDDDLRKYIEAQNIKVVKKHGIKYGQTRYGLYRCKASGLSAETYLYIADHEEELIKNDSQNKNDSE